MPEVAERELNEVLELQRALVQATLLPGLDEVWPKGIIRIPKPHQAAWRHSRPRLLAYRGLVRSSLWDPIEAVFPVTRALLGEAAWGTCREAFLADGTVQSRHYRDIPATFVAWLAAQQWGAAQWPCLLQLAHLELVEILVSFAPDPAPDSSLRAEPAFDLKLHLHPSAYLLRYAYALHQATTEAPLPTETPTHLLAFRDSEDRYQLLELTPATSALLARAQHESIGATAQALNLSDMPGVFQLLAELHQRGAILGFAS